MHLVLPSPGKAGLRVLVQLRMKVLTVPPQLLQLCPVVDVALGLVNDQLGLVNCKYWVGPTPCPSCHLCSGRARTVTLSPHCRAPAWLDGWRDSLPSPDLPSPHL